MTSSPVSSSPPDGAPLRRKTATDPDEAARQFEAVLVRQFVEVMTKDLFKSEGGGMMTGQADLQRDTMTDALTDHLVRSGTFGIADLLTTQWDRTGRTVPDGEGAAPAERPGPRRGPAAAGDALHRYAPAQGSPAAIDNDSDLP